MQIKLFVVANSDVYIPDSSVLSRIDPAKNVNDNIAERQGYSELRAHYWVWKNKPSAVDMVGFFQFRRYLDVTSSAIRNPCPYKIRRFPKGEDYSPEIVAKALEGFDLIAPLPEYTGLTVWERYGNAHRESDLRLAYKILQENMSIILTRPINILTVHPSTTPMYILCVRIYLMAIAIGSSVS